MANNLTRFDPFGELARFEPLRGVEDFLRDFRIKHALRDFDTQAMIKVDVAETDQDYTVKAELPGMNREDIKVDVDGKQVTISAETKQESEQKVGTRMVCSERFVGQCYRSFTLEHEIDDVAAAAKYQDGILELTLPKKVGKDGAKKLVIT